MDVKRYQHKIKIEQIPGVMDMVVNKEFDIVKDVFRNHICYLCRCLASEDNRLCSLCLQVYCFDCLRDLLSVGIERCHACERHTVKQQFVKMGLRQSDTHMKKI